jgi:hypothetical protein
MITTILLALGGAVIAAVVGTLWYSDKTPMGRIHMQFLGFDKLSEEEKKKKMEEGMKKMPKMYVAQMFLSFLTAFAVVIIISTSLINGVPFTMALGFVALNWLCFIVPTIGSGVLWSNNCENSGLAWKHFFSDILSNLVTLTLTALLVSFFV